MERLVVDTDLLSETATDLKAVADEFDAADRYAARLSDDVGDDDLARAVRDFASKWTKTREKLRDDIKNAADLAHGAGGTFRQVDSDLAASFDKDAS
ncbi:hypothetical protein [Luteimicrobium subarcticum]|uniref:Excreted virulence factor EspC (Type VII ESX diderm) n=1 Tax=Luteimicrobium subarcticum TaxID=620910 RepID=A0A2M8WVM1_9MICO|nr:hypothetical protein [Luteimicrobium subarcticum]PJI94970.1 excreted virulence factor EspC (type VII ESX diderm) [Luteimicrobium subarcticum]